MINVFLFFIIVFIVMELMGFSIVCFKGVVFNVYFCMDDEGVCYVKVCLFMILKVLKFFCF